MNKPQLVDSMSDGMCGYVVMSDGRHEERVRWSVTGKVTSQREAIDVAKHRLRRRRLLEKARKIVREARKSLGHDLMGFSVVDLLCDNMAEISVAEAKSLAAVIDAPASDTMGHTEFAREVLDETLRVRHDPYELDNPDARW